MSIIFSKNSFEVIEDDSTSQQTKNYTVSSIAPIESFNDSYDQHIAHLKEACDNIDSITIDDDDDNDAIDDEFWLELENLKLPQDEKVPWPIIRKLVQAMIKLWEEEEEEEEDEPELTKQDTLREIWEDIETLKTTQDEDVQRRIQLKMKRTAAQFQEAQQEAVQNSVKNLQEEEAQAHQQKIDKAKRLQLTASQNQNFDQETHHKFQVSWLSCITTNRAFHIKIPQKHVRQRDTSEECSICLQEIEASDLPDLAWCAGQCGKNFHRGCFNRWLDVQVTKVRDELVSPEAPIKWGTRISCSQCRAPWLPGPTKHQRFVGDMLDERYKRYCAISDLVLQEEQFYQGANISTLNIPPCNCAYCRVNALSLFSYCLKFLGGEKEVYEDADLED